MTLGVSPLGSRPLGAGKAADAVLASVTTYYYQTFISGYNAMQKNTASQKFVVFAFNRTTNVPLAGDAANITANLRKDFGSAVATNDVNPTEQEDGFYAFDALQAETNADVLQVFPESTTADIQVIAVPGVIYTVSAGSPDEVVQSADHTSAIAAIPTTAMRGTDGVDTATMRGTDNAATSAKQDTMETTLNAIPTTAMRGTDNALLAASAPTNFGSMVISVAGLTDANVQQINSVDVIGAGISADLWRA